LDLFELTKALVSRNSTTGCEAEVVQFLTEYLRSHGFEVELQEVAPDRNNIFAHIGDPCLVFSTHLDTVSPFFPVSEDKERIFGRGASDAKGIAAAQIKALERLKRSGVSDIGLLFVIGEEGGSDGARAANEWSNKSQFLINGEPTENKLAVGTKGAVRCEIRAQGIAAHSAYPEKGESAILKLMDVISDIRDHHWPSDPLLGESTVNIGSLIGGGQANVIPDQAQALLMFRTVSPAHVIKNQLQRIVHSQAEVHYLFEADPVYLETVEGFETTVVSFATDIPLLSRWGKPFLLGPGSILQAHSDHEYIDKSALKTGVDQFCRLARHLIQSMV
jgi:acetylornithine deacetylase